MPTLKLALNLPVMRVATGVLSLVVALGAVTALAQEDLPRTASGHPDLSGTYDVATLTPLSRPRRYGDKLTVTAEEAAEIEQYWKESLARDNAPSDPDRTAPPAGGVEIFVPEFSGAAGGVGGYNAFFVDIGEKVTQIDGKFRTSIITEPENGRMPAFTPAAQQRRMEMAKFYHENTGKAWWIDMDKGPYDHPESRPVSERCLLGFGSTSGPPMLPVMYNNLKRIVQTDDYVMIMVEMNHDARIIRLNDQHLPDQMRRWMGDSIGHWEGDTLVV
ncbi:MAG: hypothetical protein WD994_07285, partial [Pseudomonadales bacterium]